MNKQQEIYINLDDSGKLSKKEKISVYGGLVFFSKEEKDKFITQYRSIVNSIKCSYCKKNINTCNKKCPEIKNVNIKSTDKRRIMNYIKKYFLVGLIIKNELVYENILSNKASKGRYIDFTLKMLIKEIIKKLIVLNKINPYQPLKVIINIDQQTTKSNGYYDLRSGITEELIHGISNFNYNSVFKPILFSGLDLKIIYQNSSKSYVIQASDLLAGTIRRTCIDSYEDNINLNKNLELIDVKVFFP